jgi:hypothetical protein
VQVPQSHTSSSHRCACQLPIQRKKEALKHCSSTEPGKEEFWRSAGSSQDEKQNAQEQRGKVIVSMQQ